MHRTHCLAALVAGLLERAAAIQCFNTVKSWELSNAETAQVLGIEVSAASKRYVRALKRMRAVLADAEVG